MLVTQSQWWAHPLIQFPSGALTNPNTTAVRETYKTAGRVSARPLFSPPPGFYLRNASLFCQVIRDRPMSSVDQIHLHGYLDADWFGDFDRSLPNSIILCRLSLILWECTTFRSMLEFLGLSYPAQPVNLKLTEPSWPGIVSFIRIKESICSVLKRLPDLWRSLFSCGEPLWPITLFYFQLL